MKTDTPVTDRHEAMARNSMGKASCAYEYARALERDNVRLRAALAAADKAIVAGQACRSEAEFTRWMRESQQARPNADLILSNVPSELPRKAGAPRALAREVTACRG